FDIDAVDIYGLSEGMGPGVACESAVTKDGPTIWEGHFYPEIVDPFTAEVVPDGQEGERGFTSLTKDALPIVRYRTPDSAQFQPVAAPKSRAVSHRRTRAPAAAPRPPALPPHPARLLPLARSDDHPRSQSLPAQCRTRALRAHRPQPAPTTRANAPGSDGRD